MQALEDQLVYEPGENVKSGSGESKNIVIYCGPDAVLERQTLKNKKTGEIKTFWAGKVNTSYDLMTARLIPSLLPDKVSKERLPSKFEPCGMNADLNADAVDNNAKLKSKQDVFELFGTKAVLCPVAWLPFFQGQDAGFGHLKISPILEERGKLGDERKAGAIEQYSKILERKGEDGNIALAIDTYAEKLYSSLFLLLSAYWIRQCKYSYQYNVPEPPRNSS